MRVGRREKRMWRVRGRGLVLAVLGLASGCQLEHLSSEASSQGELPGGYDDATLMQSRPPEVLRALDVQSGELAADGRSPGQLSRGEHAIAISGESPNGNERWFTLFVFNEVNQTTQRKYRFHLDEQGGKGTRGGPFEWGRGGGSLVFEGSLALSHNFGGPGRPAYGREIATFRYIASRLRFDCKKLAESDSATRSRESSLTESGLLMNQVFRTALLRMETSPHLAAALATEEGMAFEHLTLDHGRAHLRVSAGVAEIRIEVGRAHSDPKKPHEFVELVKSLL